MVIDTPEVSIELRLLRYFLAVAEELHFGRAAQRLHIEQPPLSQQIRKLERQLDVELFDRTSRVVRLTPAGRILVERAHRVLDAANEAAEAARRAGRGEIGQLRIGFISTALFGVLPTVVRAFRARCPDVALTLHELASAQQLRALAAESLDVAMIRPPFPGRGDSFEYRILDREPIVACLPDTHPLAKRKTVPLGSLAHEGFVWFPRQVGPGLYLSLFRACQEAGFIPSVVYEASEIQGIVGLVAAGLGVALVPRSMQAVTIGGAVYRPLSRSAGMIPLAACWRRDDRNPTLAHLLQLLPSA